MPLTSAQIITLCLQESKAPGYTSQAGQFLNSILSDLCQTYDFALARGTFTFNFGTSQLTSAEFPNIGPGCGPYALPSDFLRFPNADEAIWFLDGVPYPMIPIDISEYDWQVQQVGNQAYPFLFATDMSQSPPLLVVWPGASGAFQCMIRYQRQMADITTPETSSTVPWFPNQRYLMKQLSGMLMGLTDDERAQTYLGDGDPNNPGAQSILRHYLQMRDDSTNRSKRVKLDRRRFSASYNTLRSTKTLGWP